MKIIICVKQVPATQNVKLDEETGVLLRSGVKSKLNPFDLHAIELALEIKERHGGETVLLTMGPPQAEQALIEGLQMGADRGVLLSDARFAGSDVLATGLALSGAICLIDEMIGGYDLILTGKQTTDGDTAQVGPEIAEFLGIPHATNVFEIGNIEIDRSLVATHNNCDSQIRVKLDLPCLLTIEKGVNTPRLPSYVRGKQINESHITKLTADDLLRLGRGIGLSENDFGAAGSPTAVVKVFPPQDIPEKELFEGSGLELGRQLADFFIKSKLI